MSKQPCSHNVLLQKGLKCHKGYLFILIKHHKKVFYKACGVHDKFSQTLAESLLAKKREEILLGKFDVEPKIEEKTFAACVPVFLKFWSTERDGDGDLVHNEKAIKGCENVFKRSLLPFFGSMLVHEITGKDVTKWRLSRIDGSPTAPPVSGTTVNREQVPLRTMFHLLNNLVETERVDRFKLPVKNPCDSVEKAAMKVHDRLLSDYEVKKLHLACLTMKDNDAWEICKLILSTVLSLADVRKLDIGDMVDINRSKTGVPVQIPITVLTKLNFVNWPVRWRNIRKEAGLWAARRSADYVDAKVLRKTGINWVINQFDLTKASGYAGHASVKTTESHYRVIQREKNREVSEFMTRKVNELEGQ